MRGRLEAGPGPVNSRTKDNSISPTATHSQRNICFIMETAEIHRSDGRMTVRQTCDFSFERAAHYVLRSSVFDGDEIVSRRHGRVSDLEALRTLPTVQFDFGRPVDVHG